MVIKELLQNSITKLRESGNDNPVFEAHAIFRHVLSLSATDLVLMHDKKISKAQEKKITSFFERRLSGEPLQYILGTQEFMSLEFKVSPSVLIPRADTETLVEYVIDNKKNDGFSLLDIGTGTGCIPLSIAAFCPRAFVRGLDISPDAKKLAEDNCKKMMLNSRASFDLCDILTEIPNGKYDVITSNPPYIKTSIIDGLQTEVKNFEPHLALDGGPDGLKFYRRICEIAPNLLTHKGLLIFEIGYDQADDVASLMGKKFTEISIIKDLCGNDRVVVGTLFK